MDGYSPREIIGEVLLITDRNIMVFGDPILRSRTTEVVRMGLQRIELLPEREPKVSFSCMPTFMR